MNLLVNVLKAFGIALGATLLLGIMMDAMGVTAEYLAGSVNGLTRIPSVFFAESGLRGLAGIRAVRDLLSPAAAPLWPFALFFPPALGMLYLSPKGRTRLAWGGLLLILTISLWFGVLDYRWTLEDMNSCGCG
jgi:hypothetical protein